MPSIANMDGSCDSRPLKRKSKDFSENVKIRRKYGSIVPKAQELENIREAETLFLSNLFKMEVEELLKEVKPDVPEQNLDDWIKKLENFLQNIPETFQTSIDEVPLNIQVPILKKTKTKGSFKFVPPENLLKIGSFVLGTVCSSDPILDVAIEIPKTCWQTMDFLNERYHRKRALYLSHIAEKLESADFVKELKYTYQNDCHLKPVLLIIPEVADIKNLTISLTAYPSEDSFKLTRFVPTRNNVRSSWLLKETDNDLDVPTPYYNSTILSDLLLPKFQSYLTESVSQNIKDGIILIKVWCIQRGLLSGYGRLNGFIVSMFVMYLLKNQKINFFMNPYQIFRCTMLALQHENFEEGISLASEADSQPSLEDFQNVYPATFMDESGFLNLMYSISKETLNMVRHEAKLGLKILDTELPNCFSLLFLNKIKPLTKFEYLIHLKGSKKFRRYAKQLCKVNDSLNFGENKIAPIIPKICGILSKGLHKRILLMDFIKSSPSPWSIYDPPPSPNCSQVTIGLLLNPDVPLSNLEKGPLADDPQAKEFREFWGNQSEMRRFQDGTIREAVFWSADTFEDKRKVFSQIVKDILKRHLNADEKDIIVTGNEVGCVLHVPKHVLSPLFPPYGTGEETHIALMQSFNSLSKQLRSLDGLPLMISSIQGISPAFHFAEVFPPLPISYPLDKSVCFVSESKMKLKGNASRVPPFTPALNVVIGFEGSGKWPDDADAIKRVKAAFLIKIAELVRSKHSLVAVPFITHTDIIKDGFVFRLILSCHKELFLMKQYTAPSGITKTRETDASRQLEITTQVLPKLNSLLHGLQQQHNTFGTACRLAKRWISAQLKHDYIHDTVVELLVAHCYCHPEPYICPSSPQTAFIRFLSLIINHEWKTNPLVVNLNNELQRDEIEGIYSAFTDQRSTLPLMVIATPLDRKGNLFTKSMPHQLILKRIQIFAKATLKTLDEKLNSMKNFDVKIIYRPPLDSYNVIIHLNRHTIPQLRCAVDIQEMDDLPHFEPFSGHVDKLYPVVEYDPVLAYLKELKANFEEFAFFFYDIYGGDFIAVVWKKSAFLPREFKASHVNGRLLNNGLIMRNVDSILEDFTLLGSGIVSCITKQKDL